MIRVLHISYSNSSSDGGVYFYLKDAINFQKKAFIDSHWLTVKNESSKLNQNQLLKKIIELKPNIIHIHGLWTITTRIIPKLKNITKNIVVSPHGMLNYESLRKSYLGRKISLQFLKKKLYLFLIEKRNLNQIKYFHALTEEEAKQIRSIFPNKPIKIISTGFIINKPKKNLKVFNELRIIFKKHKKILLFMSRLDHQKGLIELLNAWNNIIDHADKHDWFLLIAGFGNLKDSVIKNSKKINSRIFFYGPLFGENKRFVLQNSKGFILPSFNEGLPIAVLEALSFKKTCLISENCNMNKLFSSNIALKIKIDKDRNNIEETLMKFFQLSEKELQKREGLGLKYLKKNHSWDKIISHTKMFYEDL